MRSAHIRVLHQHVLNRHVPNRHDPHRHDLHRRRHPAAGFSLLELMIVVIIIAILASIAFGSYQHHVVNTRRAAAAACLQERTQRLERFHTLHLSYLDAAGNPPVLAECGDGLAQHYQLGLSAVSARAFTLQAVPQGAQAKADTRCGTLTINQLGVRAVSGTANATPGECW